MVSLLSIILIIIWTLIFTIILLWVAYKYPFIMMVLYIFVAILPFLFQMTPVYNEDKWALFIGFGLRFSDYLLIVMLVAVIIKIYLHKNNQFRENTSGFFPITVLFIAYLFFEIFRNLARYKISAFGEFRYTYFMLILPVYVVYFFTSNIERIKLFKFSIFTSLILALIFIPIIGFLKNWDINPIIDPSKRFLPSELSLGLFYGLVGLILGKKYDLFELEYYKIFLITSLAGIIILIDGHRSVWLSIIVVLIVLLLIKSKKITISYRWILLSFLIIIVLFLSISSFVNISKFLSERLLAFTAPEQDPTTNWRLLNWSFQLKRFFNSPFTGEGFGAYWGFEIYKNDIWIMPHNLYIMILAKMGIVGLILYVVLNIKIFLKLKNSLITEVLRNRKEKAIIILAFICLVGANVYAIAYPIDPRYSWLFIGLGLAVTQNKGENES